MTLKAHKKHTAMARPAMGDFGRNEYALLGTQCGAIKQLADQVIAVLSPDYQIAYADAQHSDEPTAAPGRLASGAAVEYTQQAGHQQLSFNGEMNAWQYRQLLSGCDMVLVNGNHHQAKRQIVFIDADKKASLQKRMDQLTDVQLFILKADTDELFDFVKEAIPGWEQIPVYQLSDTASIISFFKDKLTQAQPILNGLILAGGKSQRMGHDKGALNWHGKAQRYYAADLLQSRCREVFISCRDEQQAEIDPAYKTLTDTFTGLGPFGAILSAFRQQPDTAWLVLACDLPLLDAETLDYLIAERAVSAVATTFKSPYDEFPEPLITIWEPKSYPLLLAFLAQGYSCPRKVLINSDTKVLNAPNPDALTNVNTPEELERVKQIIDPKTITA